MEVEGEKKADDEEELSQVPKISMDYFFLGGGVGENVKVEIAAMSTKELRKKLRIAQLPANGSRNEMEKRYNDFRKATLAEAGLSSSEEEGEGQEEVIDKTHPALVMIDEQTGNKYMRVVGQKGIGSGGEMRWLIKDLHEELKAWGRPGGDQSKIILKTDGEPAIIAVREALA